MAPNLVGNNFLLAESVISATKSNNNNSKSNSSSSSSSRNCKQLEIESNNVVTLCAISEQDPKWDVTKSEIVWRNVLAFTILHVSAIYGIYLAIAEIAIIELIFGFLLLFLGGMGITAGAHRLWSHRAYKAKLPLRIFLMLCNSMSFQNSIYEWTRDHRVHHKFTDTNADPHNSQRGFFFAHMGWLMCRKHKDVKIKGKSIDMTDLEADPVVMFQKKYYLYVMPIFCFVVPTLIPYFCWGSSFARSFFICSALRYCISLHGTWLVNSAAHFYGMKPYDKSISSVNTKLVAILTYGEGWHNYHHVFPWDYKAAELGNYHNWTTAFLNMAAKIGQAYDLKTVSEEMILKRIQRTGDLTQALLNHNMKDLNNNVTSMANGNLSFNDMILHLDHENEKILVWGWDDTDISEEDRNAVNILQEQKQK